MDKNENFSSEFNKELNNFSDYLNNDEIDPKISEFIDNYYLVLN